jgi:outer membrane protein assembly factor BamB
MRSLPLGVAAVLAVVAVVVDPAVMGAADWPQILGPTRDGRYEGAPLSTAWPDGGPTRVWRKSVGEGFAGPVVVGDRVILFHRQRNEEVVESLDRATGNSVWRYAYRTAYRDDFGFDEGPRAVPVVADGRIYTFGAEGQLHAIDLASGQRIWSVDTMRQFSVRKGFFGAAGSPLVEDGRVIANIGGTANGAGAGIVAFDAATGDVLWSATDHPASYSSPVGATFGGQRHALFFTRYGLVGLHPATGAVLFERPWRSRSQSSVNAASPLVIGDLIFLSATYETGAAVLRVTGSQLSELWSSDDVMSNHYATSVYANGHLYGYHGRQEFTPSFRAVDINTGDVKWNVNGFRAGTVTLAGDNQLVIVRENGELVLAPASPEGFKPVARSRVLSGTVRALPALSDGFLYLRNENTLVCLDLRAS